MGVKICRQEPTLSRLSSQIHVVLNGPEAAVIEAERGVITNDPREIVLDHPHLQRVRTERVQADQATVSSDPRNQVERILATGKRHD